jgi:hypothetical protein
MAKKLKPGQKLCPSCGTSVSGPRTKVCPKCNHEFKGKPQKSPTIKAAPAKVEPAKHTENGSEKPEVNKAQSVRDYLTANPAAGPSAVVAALKKQGIDVAPNYVAAIKSKLNKTSTVKEVAKPAPQAAPAPVAVERPATAGGTITLEQIKQVAQTVKSLGGLRCATEILEVIKEMGGPKKFKELAEAMTVTEVDVVVF